MELGERDLAQRSFERVLGPQGQFVGRELGARKVAGQPGNTEEQRGVDDFDSRVGQADDLLELGLGLFELLAGRSGLLRDSVATGGAPPR